MTKTLYLIKRGEVWHYYRRVPTALVALVGKKFIKKSLGVKDQKSAKCLCNLFNIEVDAKLSSAENALVSIPESNTKNSPVSIDALTEYLRQHVSGLDDCKAARLIDDPPNDEAQRKEMKQVKAS